MLLSEIFEYITYSELSNLGIITDDDGQIPSKNYPKVIANLNLGLIDLHKRFPILLKEVRIQLYQHITNYILHSDYAQSNQASTKTYKYIIDSPYYPFTNDLIRINRAINEDGTEYVINNEDEVLSLFTPSYNILQVPYPVTENTISVEYVAYPTKIPTDTTDLTTINVELPEYLLGPLLTYLAYKLYSSVGLDKPETINYLKKYEIDCKQLIDLGVMSSDTRNVLRFGSNRWV